MSVTQGALRGGRLPRAAAWPLLFAQVGLGVTLEGRHTCVALAEEWGRDALLVGAGAQGALRAVGIVPQGLTCYVSSAVISPKNGCCDRQPGAGHEEA